MSLSFRTTKISDGDASELIRYTRELEKRIAAMENRPWWKFWTRK